MKSFCILLLTVILSLDASANRYSVTDFGARGDGKTIDSDAINKAIEAASQSGGGTVYFPAGTYASYSIRLKSHISLYLDQGATILAADPQGETGYDAPEPNKWGDSLHYQDFGHSHWHNSLIWGEDLVNISILGPGTIYGKGLTREGPHRSPIGNKAIALKNCRNVILRDFTMLYGGHFAILATGVDNLTIDNLKIDTNRDGIDVDCCKNVRISNCTINSPWDDALCLKSSYALGYARATENVTITNCQVTGFDRGTLIDGTYQENEGHLVPDREGPTGRIKFGTESNGGFKKITISNCIFQHCRGLALETVDGGLLEDIAISNLVMNDIINSPFFLRLGGRMRGPADATIGELRRVSIDNVVVYNADSRFSSIISGLPGHDIKDIRLSNISIWYKPINPDTDKIPETVPEYEKAYPEPQKFGIIPSYGFFIRHVQHIEMSNINIRYLEKETRPAIIFSDVKGIEMLNVAMMKAGTSPLISAENVTGFRLKDCPEIKDITLQKITKQSF